MSVINDPLKDKINDFLKLPETIAVIVGAGVGWYSGFIHVGRMFGDTSTRNILINGFGNNADNMLQTAFTIGGAVIAYTATKAVASFLKIHRLDGQIEVESRKIDSFYYKLPPWPKQTGSFKLIFGEKHEAGGAYVANPEWYAIPEKGLFGNVVIFGGIGSGKTQGAAYPFVRQLISYNRTENSLKVAGLVLDVKGNFVSKVKDIVAESGRQKDLIIIRPGGQYKWNPIHAPHLDSGVIAGRLMSIYDNLNSNSQGMGGQWVKDGVFKLLDNAIGLLRYANDYVTIADVNNFISATSGEEVSGENPVDVILENYIEILSNKSLSALEIESVSQHLQFFKEQWRNENPKNKATFIGAATSITGLFSKPSIAATFCPKQEEIDFPGFEKLLDTGQIVCLGMSDAEYGVLAGAIGILLKLEFQRAALSRPARSAADSRVNKERILFFIADEYQNFVSAGNKAGAEGDDNFYALSRESRCINIVLAQSPVSLISRIGSERTRVILASLRNKIFFALTDYEDIQLAANICGRKWKTRKNVSISDQRSKVGWNPVSGSISGKNASVSEQISFVEQYDHAVEPHNFARLRAFESIVCGFDGISQLSPHVVYTKPDFTGKDIPHNLIMKQMQDDKEK